MLELTLGPLSESWSAPGGHQLVGQVPNDLRVSLWADIGRAFTQRHLYYYSAIRLILISLVLGG